MANQLVYPCELKHSNKQKQENKCPLRCTSLPGVEFFPMRKEEREGAALGTCVLLFMFMNRLRPYLKTHRTKIMLMMVPTF